MPNVLDVWPVQVENVSSFTCPPFGLLEIVSTTTTGDGLQLHRVTRPTGGDKQYLVNQPVQLAAGRRGAARSQAPVVVAYTGSVAPSVNQDWGPVANSFYASANGSGFIVQGVNTGNQTFTAGLTRTVSGVDHPIVSIANTGATTLLARRVVGMATPFENPANLPAFLSRVPKLNYTPPTTGGPFAITLADILPGGSGDAVCVGLVQCYLDFKNATHARCGPVAGDTAKLTSSDGGPALIVWREKQGLSGGLTLGVQLALVFIDAVGASSQQGFVGIVTSAISGATYERVNDTGVVDKVTPGSGMVQEFEPDPDNPPKWRRKGSPVTWNHWLGEAVPADHAALAKLAEGYKFIDAANCSPVPANTGTG